MNDTKTQKQGRDDRISPDGKWRSFPKVPNLLQYVPSGNYFGRIKIDGKVFRKSLNTDVWTTAKLRLPDFILKEQKQQADMTAADGKPSAPTFGAAVELFKHDLNRDANIKPASKRYRLWCLHKLQKTWPGLWEMRLDEITAEACKDWAANVCNAMASHYFNNVLGTLRQVFETGRKAHEANGGTVLALNPTLELKRVRVKQTELHLPEAAQFKTLIENLRLRSGAWGTRIGDLVEFLAYSGMRIQSEAIWVKWEDVDWQRKEIIVRGNPETGTKNNEMRRIPIITGMENLLVRLLRGQDQSRATGIILKIRECSKALARACQELGIPRLTHHDLRHLFATRCIESGVDIPTVSRWLGHKDGGALAMKTYGHLRNEHSQAMAQKVKF